MFEIIGYEPKVHAEPKVAKIIYYYNHELKLYAFLMQDDEENTIEYEYCGKPTLQATKEYIINKYGIKPVLLK